jgi:hypothetical protein
MAHEFEAAAGVCGVFLAGEVAVGLGAGVA